MDIEIDFPANIQGCIYKLWYADRYIVVKCKFLTRSIMGIKSDLHYFLKGTKGGNSEKHLYYDFCAYVEANPGKNFNFELLLASDHPLELLKCEHISLEAAYGDERCLNRDFNVYIPQFTQVNGKKSWINRGYYLNFMQWKKKREQSRNNS